eukprot:87754-Rhodomonas_salina.1
MNLLEVRPCIPLFCFPLIFGCHATLSFLPQINLTNPRRAGNRDDDHDGDADWRTAHDVLLRGLLHSLRNMVSLICAFASALAHARRHARCHALGNERRPPRPLLFLLSLLIILLCSPHLFSPPFLSSLRILTGRRCLSSSRSSRCSCCIPSSASTAPSTRLKSGPFLCEFCELGV